MFFIRERRDGGAPQLWMIDDQIGEPYGITNPPRYAAAPGETALDAIRRLEPGWFGPNGESPFHKTMLRPGEYHPRMIRGIFNAEVEGPGFCPSWHFDLDALAVALAQLGALAKQLERICQTIHPSSDTFDAFGHDIRNLLILACTEIETHWRGVFKANGYLRRSYNTADYVLLRDAMKLGAYGIAFPRYPWLGPFFPFRDWHAVAPTESLDWYHAYNAVKHDRETNFRQAKLRHVFGAVAACAVMLIAQFGLPKGWDFHLTSNMSLVHTPTWRLGELYIAPEPSLEVAPTLPEFWSAVNFSFPPEIRRANRRTAGPR